MEAIKRCDNYPARIVILSNLVSLGIYGLGFFVIQKTGWVFAGAYLLYILVFEYRLIRYHCTSCYYWNKICGFGRGKLSSWFFKKGDISKFCMKDMSWKDMIPDFLITLIPLVTGIVMLIIQFDVLLLSAILIIILLTTIGNGYIRGSLTCKYCKQQELGCPADLMFNKNKQK